MKTSAFKIIIIICYFIVSNFVKGQVPLFQTGTVGNDKESNERYSTFISNKTYVLIDDEKSVFGQAFMKSVEANWTVTKYEFINTTDALSLLSDPNNSFLYFARYQSEENGKIVYGGYFLMIANGKRGTKKIGKTDLVFEEYIGQYRELDQEDLQTLAYVIPFYIKNITTEISDYSTKSTPLSEFDNQGNGNYVLYSNNSESYISGMKILIREGLTDTIGIKNLSKKLKMNVDNIKIVSLEEISKAITNADTSVAVVLLDGTGLFIEDGETKAKDKGSTYNVTSSTGCYIWTTTGKLLAKTEYTFHNEKQFKKAKTKAILTLGGIVLGLAALIALLASV